MLLLDGRHVVKGVYESMAVDPGPLLAVRRDWEVCLAVPSQKRKFS